MDSLAIRLLRPPKRAVQAFCRDFVGSLGHRIRCLKGQDVHIPSSVRRNKLALGAGDGRWVICPDGLNASSVVYSVGIGTDISFDLAFIDRFSCQVQALDPTPLALQWLKSQTVPAEFKMHPWGLASYDGTATFALPEKHSVSFTMSAKVASKATAECPVYRLREILDRLGHDHIDLLKIDIEGAEYDVLDDLAAESGRINQLLVEFHHRWTGSAAETERFVRRIEACGLQLFHVSSRGFEYSFVRAAQ